jgi:hypothetical protein
MTTVVSRGSNEREGSEREGFKVFVLPSPKKPLDFTVSCIVEMSEAVTLADLFKTGIFEDFLLYCLSLKEEERSCDGRGGGRGRSGPFTRLVC